MRYYGWYVADVRALADLAEFFDPAELAEDGLVIRRPVRGREPRAHLHDPPQHRLGEVALPDKGLKVAEALMEVSRTYRPLQTRN